MRSGDNPKKGVVYYLLGMFSFQLNFIFAKILYTRNPSFTPFQLLFYRSVLSTAIMSAIENKNLKKTMIDSVNRTNIVPLAVRVVQANFSVTVNFTSVKYFTLTQTAIVNQTSPLITTVLAMFILNEQLIKSNVVVLLVAFCGVIMMIAGKPDASVQ
jgi:drug/metabolite transporter (DMT)-like permease